MIHVICSYLLLPIALCSAVLGSFDGRELAKLPNVVTHYQHHRTAHGQPDLSFFEFLADHIHASSSNDPEHQDLPILGASSGAPSVLPSVDGTCFDGPEPSGSIEPIIEAGVQHLRDGRELDVFQPPRIA